MSAVRPSSIPLFGSQITRASVAVRYSGILPDLFAEGEGVVAEGMLDGAGTLVATQVLAKHDENYMPPEVAAALEGKIAPADRAALP